MRYTLLLCAVLAFVSCEKDTDKPEKPDACDSDSCDNSLKNGLMAYYPFSGDFDDASGNGNHATAKNGAHLSTDMVGRQSAAAIFDGMDDYAITTETQDLLCDTITISCEVLINSIGRRNALINFIEFETPKAFAWGLGQSLETDNNYSFAVAPASEDCETKPLYDPSNAAFSNVIIAPGRWYNVVATFINGKQNIYIDGQLKASISRSFNKLKKCSASQLILGGWWAGDIISLDGKMDEVRIYDRELSQCEITHLASKFVEPALD